MSLSKLKKAELVALAEANDFSIDSDWNKSELVAALEDMDITTENSDAKPESKVDRQARLQAR